MNQVDDFHVPFDPSVHLEDARSGCSAGGCDECLEAELERKGARTLDHLVMFSGGIGSWYAAKRVAELRGTKNLYLIFADTMMEDEDLYRFIEEAAKDVGGTLVKIAEGRNPWQVFFDSRYLGNSRIDPCSRVLKREFIRKYLNDNFNPNTSIVYLGIDWTEIHRYEKAKGYWKPWVVEAPLCQRPLVSKPEMLAELERVGIEIPRLYKMGFSHNNCGGFCVKAGQAHFRLLLDKMPERYAYHEQMEQSLRDYLQKDVTILKKQMNGKTHYITLSELKAMRDIDEHDWGGCGCFSDENEQ